MRYQRYDPKGEEIGFHIASLGMSEDEATRVTLDKWTYQELMHVVGTRVCDKTGHKIVDESYGNPDSGCMAGYCRRCGYSFHVTLY